MKLLQLFWRRELQFKSGLGRESGAGWAHISSEEIEALLNACRGPSVRDQRDLAMFSMVQTTGARLAEIASVRLVEVREMEEGRLRVSIIGKGNKERAVYVDAKASEAVMKWMQTRSTNVPGGYLFCPIAKDGRIIGSRLSGTAMDKILARRAGEAGIEAMTWHDFRRTVAGNLLDAKVDIATVAKILGHANIETTARYDRRGECSKMKAIGAGRSLNCV